MKHTKKMMNAQLPTQLRVPCEELMIQVQNLHQTNFTSNTGNCIASLQKLIWVLRELPKETLQRWIEYISIPLLLLLPTDASKSAEVPERIREECFNAMEILIKTLPEMFAVRRIDLYFPLFLRTLAALTDMANEGQLMRNLKEETKLSALRLLYAMFTLQCAGIELNNKLTLHCAALVLDLTLKSKEKSIEIRILAIETLGALITNDSLVGDEDIEFMFPGASSNLCESSQMDFKSGQRVVLVSLQVLLVLCKRLGDLTKVIKNLFPLLVRIWKHSGQDPNKQVKLARTRLACQVLLHSNAALDEEQITFLVRQVLLLAACEEEEECTTLFTSVQHLCAPDHILVDSLCVKLQDPTCTMHDLENELNIACFLLKHNANSPVLTIKLELAFTDLQWSLLFAFACDDSRVEQSGRVEYYRIANLQQASKLFTELVHSRPQLASRLFDSFLDSLACSIDEDDDGLHEQECLLIPQSQLPQTLYMLSQLKSNDGDERLLLALLEMEPLWYSERVDALVKIAALDCIATCTSHAKTLHVVLVDVLYPVLHSLGDEHQGVKIAAERCLQQMAHVMQHTTVASLLQNNVDYVVDALVRRLPQLLPGDVRFSNVIHALVERIPVWVQGEEASPWVDDLIFTILQGLDNRTNTPQVVWSLLRIAQVIVHRANEVSEAVGGVIEHTPTSRVKSHEDYVDECISELAEWIRPTPPGADEDKEEEDAKEEDKDQGTMDPFESVLDKCVIFFSDYDVLVRHQAFKVASFCVTALGRRNQSKARQAVHRMWPSVIEQLQEERNPEIVSLLLDSLLVVAAQATGAEFFANRFVEEAWPVLESILQRGSTDNKKSFRNIQLAKRVLDVLPKLSSKTLVGLHAERIALATGAYFRVEELKREAFQVWLALAECGAGDYIWLPVAVASGNLAPGGIAQRFTLPEREHAGMLWEILQAQ